MRAKVRSKLEKNLYEYCFLLNKYILSLIKTIKRFRVWLFLYCRLVEWVCLYSKGKIPSFKSSLPILYLYKWKKIKNNFALVRLILINNQFLKKILNIILFYYELYQPNPKLFLYKAKASTFFQRWFLLGFFFFFSNVNNTRE